jgi:hypothetical protein
VQAVSGNRCRFALILKGMKAISCFLFAVTLAISASAQKVYFIYLQTENNTPFYVRMDDKVYSSAVSGYLILSNLPDSIYKFSLGFPGSASDSRFVVPVSGRDRGFVIKRSGEGLGLFDLQNSSVIREQSNNLGNIQYQKRNDDFTLLLSRASNDSGILFVPVVLKETVAVKNNETREPVKEPVKKEEVLVKADNPVSRDTLTTTIHTETTPEVKKAEDPLSGNTAVVLSDAGNKVIPEPKKDIPDSSTKVSAIFQPSAPDSVTAAVYHRSKVKKHSESSLSEGFGLVFYDIDEAGTDTIRVMIPNPKIQLRQQDTVADDGQMLDLKKDPVGIIVSDANSSAGPKAACKVIATEADLAKLRKSMSSKNTDEDMVNEAKKQFKSRCFTTEQVKGLSSLFLTSAGKYQFFDAAYLHVSDREQFGSLESEIRDDYYLKRFKALVGE